MECIEGETINILQKPHPVAGMRVKFKTTEGKTHTGIYDFNGYSQRRWFDEDNYEYTSDMIDEWEEIEGIAICGN